ncbi:MAG: undecaprenyl-diphosphate phosphatase [Ignavibacteriaceae bacterium]|nr:undecaprenyl-diphosphate phosphatase [Ignavibacteriaceae bacterium]
MSLIEAIILGIIQGITEFLPISSTGHLTLAARLMDLLGTPNHLINPDSPEKWTAFIAVIQLGTLAAVLIYFLKDIINIIRSFLNENLKERKSFANQSTDSRLGWLIILGTIPVVIIGLSFKHIIEGNLTKDLWVISCSLILLAIILFIAEKKAKFKKEIKDITIKDALIIGIAQCFALIPGSSRSGTTITGGLFMGLKRESAARFSFLLSIPAVLASGLLELKESLPNIDGSMATHLIVSTIVAGICGYLAIDFLLKFLKKNTTFVFIIYRIVLGITILTLLFNNIILP